MKRDHLIRSWALGLALTLLLPATVWAGFASIDTDDGIIDPDWASVTTFQTSPDDAGIDNAYDIKETRLTGEADGSLWYFQVVLYGQLPLDNLTSIEARISCNGDAAFDHVEDKIALYYHADPSTNDNSLECEGSDYPTCSLGEMQGSDFGEEIAVGDGTYSYEWKADLADAGGTDWSTCLGTETVQFVVADEDGNIYDSTPPTDYNAPSSTQLSRLQGSASSIRGLAAVLGLGLALGYIALKRQTS